MNGIDWESKFNAIVRDTVHNLDKVKVCVQPTRIGEVVILITVNTVCV